MKNFTLQPLRSSMGRALEHAANAASKKKGFGLREILRNKKEKEKIADAVANARFKVKDFAAKKSIGGGETTGMRFSRVKKAKGGYQASGLGFVPAANFEELKSVLRENSYSHLIFGAVKTTTLPKVAKVKSK